MKKYLLISTFFGLSISLNLQAESKFYANVYSPQVKYKGSIEKPPVNVNKITNVDGSKTNWIYNQYKGRSAEEILTNGEIVFSNDKFQDGVNFYGSYNELYFSVAGSINLDVFCNSWCSPLKIYDISTGSVVSVNNTLSHLSWSTFDNELPTGNYVMKGTGDTVITEWRY